MISFRANILIGLVVLLQVYFLVLETFLRDKPVGLKAFGRNLEFARQSKVLAINQGLYNGFLALGLGQGLSLGADGSGIMIFSLAA